MLVALEVEPQSNTPIPGVIVYMIFKSNNMPIGFDVVDSFWIFASQTGFNPSW